MKNTYILTKVHDLHQDLRFVLYSPVGFDEHIMTCIQQKSFTAQISPMTPLCIALPLCSASLWQLLIFVHSLKFSLFQNAIELESGFLP